MTTTHHATSTESPWLSTVDVAAYLGVSIDTVRAWRYRGDGPTGYRVGRHVRYHRTEVDAWVLSGAGASSAA